MKKNTGDISMKRAMKIVIRIHHNMKKISMKRAMKIVISTMKTAFVVAMTAAISSIKNAKRNSIGS